MTSRAVDRDAFLAYRRDLVGRPGCRFVDEGTWRTLLVSRQRLERRDDPRARARGLRDPRTGDWYLIEEEKLLAV